MIKKIIYISVEVKSREYLPKLFFASRAISKGFDCFIGDKIAIAKAINFFGPGIYFYKSINHYDTNHIKRVKKTIYMLLKMKRRVLPSQMIKNLINLLLIEVAVKTLN